MSLAELDIWDKAEIQRIEQEDEGAEKVAQANQILIAAEQLGVKTINLDLMECWRQDGNLISGKRRVENLANNIALDKLTVDVNNVLMYIVLSGRRWGR